MIDGKNMRPDKDRAGLYIHIPFCLRKCLYCDFLSFAVSEAARLHEGAGGDIRREYVSALIRELAAKAGTFGGRRISSVYIGGGTPSCLEEGEIARIMKAVPENYSVRNDAEITIEVNPCTATEEKLEEYLASGIGRISFGVQSADDKLLKTIGRLHDFETAKRAVSIAKKAGFSNINLDMMYALPGMTVRDCKDTLERFLELEPEHISAYSLIIEEGTPFYEMYGQETGGKGRKVSAQKEGEKSRPEFPPFPGEEGQPRPLFPPLPGEEEEEEMYLLIDETLKSAGFSRYEISNYARPGFESRHNSLYWQRGEYLGVGLGAASLIDRCRYRNISDLERYVRTSFAGPDAVESVTKLTPEDEMSEFMFLGLRMTEGVSRARFEKCFGRSMDEVFGSVIDKYVKLGLLESENDMLRLTERGFRLSNTVFAEMV